MSNYMDEDNASDFLDIPDEVNGISAPNTIQDTQTAPVQRRPINRIATQVPVQQQVIEEQEEEIIEEEIMEESDEDFSEVLTDARLRLEQGRLYELVMNSDLFNGSDCDPKAIKNVEKEIRRFAKERMEIMLGMRQEAPKNVAFSAEGFPFNSLEVEALRAVASAATQGATKKAEPFTVATVQRKQTLNPISVKSNRAQPVKTTKSTVAVTSKPLPTKPSTPIKRARPSEAVQRILQEEGVTLEQVNEVFDPNQKYLSPEELNSLSAEEILERNRQIAARTQKQVPSRQAIPMPPQDQIEAIYTNRANAAAANPQMQTIMALLNNRK